METRLKRQLIYLLFLLLVLGVLRKGHAEPVLNVAVAANFAPAMEELGREFTGKTGIPVRMTVSSTGRLFAQIKQRAPFDLYFSADTGRPEKLHEDGLCGEPRLYAVGQTVLWSRDPELCALGDWKRVVNREGVTKIAMANPGTAPYGAAARQACMQLAEWPAIEKKLVYGTNVGQAFQYAQAGVAGASFVALSLALSEKGREGCYWEIAGAEPVEQKACLVAYSGAAAPAALFLDYVTSGAAGSLREHYGYR